MTQLRTPYSHAAGQIAAIDFPTAATTASTTTEIYFVAADRNFKIARAVWIPAASLATSDTAYAVISVQTAAGLIMAQWSTKLTGGNGALVAGTHVSFVLSATPANLWQAGNGAIKFAVTCTSTPSVPAGVLRVEGDLL